MNVNRPALVPYWLESTKYDRPSANPICSVPSPQLIPGTRFQQVLDHTQQISEIEKQLKIITEQIKELQKPTPTTNIFLQKTEQKTEQPIPLRKHFLPRKSVDARLIPEYVITGKATCDRCQVTDLLKGFHHGDNADLCPECMTGIEFAFFIKGNWIEFTV